MTSEPNDQSAAPDPTTVEAADGTEEHGGVEVDADTQSDPSLDDSHSTEWADEGGATEEGPATDS